ncbi:MAG: DNA primase [Desulfobacterota bacterium]|nr:DNA primase [Thermodesulfobacteriota bacterium]
MATAGAYYIPDDKVREIREACSIVGVISEYITLTKSGANYKGLCPFHSEKTPSFFVNESKKFFHCFGCGASGDVFTFLMKRENVSFIEAVTTLARKYGVSLPDKPLTLHQQKQLSEREALFRITEQAAAFYHRILLHDARAIQAREYLKQRGITSDTVQAFMLGYAPEGWDSLTVFLREQGISLPAAQRIGLLVSKGGDHYYDRFRGRLMFPVFNIARNIIGFGGRVIGDGEPKYLNSPESPLYAKRFSLYGLPQAAAAIRQHDCAIIVEGYFDLLSLHQAGITNAVAALGTALTEQQIVTLRRYTQRIITVFDADLSGQKAMIRSLEPLLKQGVSPRIVLLPSGEDPDSFIRKAGATAFQAKVNTAPPLLDFALETIIAQHDLATPHGKVLASDAVLPVLSLINDPLERDLYLQKIARRLDVDPRQLRRRRAAVAPQTSCTEPTDKTAVVSIPPSDNNAEAMVIKLMMHYPEKISTVEQSSLLDDFMNEELKKIGSAIMAAYRELQCVDMNVVLAMIPEPQVQMTFSRLAFQEDVTKEHAEKILLDCIKTIRLKKNKAERRQVTLLLKQAEAARDERATISLQRRYAQLIEQEKQIFQLQRDYIHS